MHGFPALWCVAGGWAIDLFLGRVTRPHNDVELAIFRHDQGLLHRQFPDWEFRKVVAGHFAVWEADEQLSLPIHEIHAHTDKAPPLAIEFLLNERFADDWAFRRDLRVRLPLEQAVRQGDGGLPILNPAIVLLYKAKSRNTKDESDFQSVRAALETDDRRWLRAALETCNPGHHWLPLLDTTAS